MRTIIFLLGFFGVMTGSFFGSAGRWDLPLAWVCLGVCYTGGPFSAPGIGRLTGIRGHGALSSVPGLLVNVSPQQLASRGVPSPAQPERKGARTSVRITSRTAQEVNEPIGTTPACRQAGDQ